MVGQMTADQKISHLLRRFGLGAGQDELAKYRPLGVDGAPAGLACKTWGGWAWCTRSGAGRGSQGKNKRQARATDSVGGRGSALLALAGW